MLPVLLALPALAGSPPATPEPVLVEHGVDTGRGNLVGIQPWMTARDYASAKTFRDGLDRWFAAAAERGWLQERTIVVLPEYLGTWLVALDEPARVIDAPTLDKAMGRLLWRYPLRTVGRIITSGARARAVDAVFQLKADAMAAAFHGAFSDLAARHRVTVVAGSILLPDPAVVDGVLVAGRGRLQNVSAVYGPDGRAFPDLVRKVQPTEDERPFVRGGAVEALPVFPTPAGNLGVLVCADSWYPHTYERLADQDVAVLAVPGFLSKDGAWGEPWHGYDGAPAPTDVDPADVERITEGEAWLRYALAYRGPDSGAEVGVNVFLRGELWDLGDDGEPVAVIGREVHRGPSVDAPVIVNVWLGEEPLTAEELDAAEAAGAPAHPGGP